MRLHPLGIIELDEATICLSVIQQSQLVCCETLPRHHLDALHRLMIRWPKVSWLIAIEAVDEEWWADRLPPVRLSEAGRLQQDRLIALDRSDMLGHPVIQGRLPDGRRDWNAWIGLLPASVVQEGLSLLPFPCPTVLGVHTLTSLHLAVQVARAEGLRITLYVKVQSTLLLIEDQVGLRFRRQISIASASADWIAIVAETRRYWEGSQPPETSQLTAQVTIWVTKDIEIDATELKRQGWQVFVAGSSLFVPALLSITPKEIPCGFLPTELKAAHLHLRVRRWGIAGFAICLLLTIVIGAIGWHRVQVSEALVDNYQQKRSSIFSPTVGTGKWRATRAPLLSIDQQLNRWPSPRADWLQLSQALNHFQHARVSSVTWSLMGAASTPVWRNKKRTMRLEASFFCPAGTLLDCNQHSYELLQNLREQMSAWRTTQVKLPLSTARQTEISSENLSTENTPVAGYVLETAW